MSEKEILCLICKTSTLLNSSNFETQHHIKNCSLLTSFPIDVNHSDILVYIVHNQCLIQTPEPIKLCKNNQTIDLNTSTQSDKYILNHGSYNYPPPKWILRNSILN